MKRLGIVLTLLSVLALPLFVPRSAAALFEGAKDQACQGVALTDTPTACDASSSGKVNDLLKIAINGFSLVVGVIAVIMIIVGGVKYITSSGDSSNTTSAKNTILYAIIGLVVVALAQVIVRFVLNRTSSLPACPAGATTLADGSPCKTP